MKEIILTQGFVAIVDDVDFERLSKFKWYAAKLGRRKTPYAVRGDYSLGRKKRRTIFMHSELCSEGVVVDHIDGNTLNNTRKNLRPCSKAQNSQNRHRIKKQGGRPTSFKGVCWHKHRNKWHAHICVNGKKRSLGYFSSDVLAANRYNHEAIKEYGEFAVINAVSPIDVGCGKFQVLNVK